MKYRTPKQRGLFEEEQTIAALASKNDVLARLKEVLDFERFRPMLEEAVLPKTRKSNAGRRPIDPVLMMKVLFLQRLYGMSDEQTEFNIADRTTFREFLDIRTVEDVPDRNTIWFFREKLTNAGVAEKLFASFNEYLDSIGLIVNEGKIVDASFVIAPRQRNTREENTKIKEGKGDELWSDNPNKKRHKDIDARWAKKRGETFFGYKDNIEVCRKTKLIRNQEVTSAKDHDSKQVDKVIGEGDAEGELLWLDAGYVGTEDRVRAKGLEPIICEKGHRGHPLTEEQKESNRLKSKVRARVEHVFGYMEQTMGGLVFRGVGMVRATFNIIFTNLVYNMCRLEQIRRYHPIWICEK